MVLPGQEGPEQAQGFGPPLGGLAGNSRCRLYQLSKMKDVGKRRCQATSETDPLATRILTP